jgi:hypothetical protein
VSLLLYAIAECSPAHITGRGVDGRPLRALGDHGLVAVISDHDTRPAFTEDALWAYEHAVERLMSHHVVLPARFGSTFETESAVRGLLLDRCEELTAAFERVRGAVELGVRASWPIAQGGSKVTGPNAGTAYMLGRLEVDRRAREIAARVDPVLGELARMSSCRVLVRPTVPVAAAYLVEHERVHEFVARVQELDATIEGAELVCTGPWPPYSFVEGGGRD